MGETANEKEKQIKRGRVKSATVEGIDVTTERAQPNPFEDDSEKNVGIYARVSTYNSQQTMSYEMQQKYYAEMIARHPNWKLVKIYADEGKTGTNVRHRESFNRMNEECQSGEVNLIITKSVSRFSRNIVDAIAYVRALAAQNPAVGVDFENEGIYTLSADSEMRLAFTAAIAQEESRTKSVAMNSSLDMRFSHGMFLTPPLLGYDNDGDGKLVINENEASTVRLIFFMYLFGYSTSEIAKKLSELGRTTKKGSTQWSAGSVYSHLTNERHCGAIKGRKTWTPNFLDHLAKKNRTYADGSTDKKQYIKQNHHEAIISPDDFIAVQKMIANAKYGNHCYLPQLQVINGGVLHGFVSVNPHWAAFSAEDYMEASVCAGEANTKSVRPQIEAKRNDIDLRYAEMVRGENFVDAYVSCVTFKEDRLRFSSACIRKFNGAEYAELLVHPARKLLAVRPCGKENKNAIRWAISADGRTFGRDIGCMAYIHTLYTLLGWEPDTKYRLRCTLYKTAAEVIAVFDAKDAQVFISKNSLYVAQKKSIRTHDFYMYLDSQAIPHSRKKETNIMYNPLSDIHVTPERELVKSIIRETQYIAHGN